MDFHRIKTWLALLFALMLNVVWASGSEWVICIRPDGLARVELLSTHGCDGTEHAAEHDDGECLESDCDDVPIGQTMPVLGRISLGRKLSAATSPQLLTAGPSACGNLVRASAGSSGLPHSLLHLRTVILRL